MITEFISLKGRNFKAHRDLDVKFGDLTKITGDNAMGKSSILEIPPFVFYGTDLLGSKTDPTPINYEFDYVKAELLVSIDGKEYLLARGIEKGKTTYYINDVPRKATEFDEFVKSLFDKDLFLSLLYPPHYYSLHWESQRAMLLRYVTAPANKEVFKQLPEAQADKLAELVKKHSIEDLEKIHRDNKTRQDKAYIAAQSRTKTLQEHVERWPKPSKDFDIEEAQAKASSILEKIKSIEMITDSVDDHNRKIVNLQNRVRMLAEQRDSVKTQVIALNNEQIADSCRVCGQALEGEAKAAAEADKTRRIDELKSKFDEVVKQRKASEAEQAQLEYIDVAEQLEQIRELEQQYRILMDAIRDSKEYERLQADVDKAHKDELTTLASRNESVFILDAIKAFSAKEAELQADKVQSLFTTLSLRLFKENKGDGEIKPDFEIMMDGKPYRKLSLSEGIRAGLELRDVLSEQSGVVAPCIVDNAESITRFRQPNGQLITSRVVAGQELKIETEEQQ